jgi:hypothetical protein
MHPEGQRLQTPHAILGLRTSEQKHSKETNRNCTEIVVAFAEEILQLSGAA